MDHYNSQRLSCLSVCLVTLFYCGQTVGWIKMSVGTKVGLGPGHIVLDGDPAIPTERGTAVPQLLRPMSIVAKLSSSQQLLSSCYSTS